MTKQYFTRDEVKTLLREAIKRRDADKPVMSEEKPDVERIYTREEVEAIIRKDRQNRNAASTTKEA